MRRPTQLGTFAVVVLGLLLVPAVAHAYAPSGDDFITCTADGSTVDCVAGIFAAGCETTVRSSTGFGDTVTASAEGEIGFAFEVPAEHGEGDVAVTLRCGEGDTKVLSDVIATVEGGEVIAVTGVDTVEMLALGVAALVTGAGILAISRPSRISRAGRGAPTT